MFLIVLLRFHYNWLWFVFVLTMCLHANKLFTESNGFYLFSTLIELWDIFNKTNKK